MALREYQSNVINELRYQLGAGLKRLMMYAPTGAGKSVIMEAITEMALAKGKRVAIIANRIHLVRQLSDRFVQSGIAHGILQGNNTQGLDCSVVVCSIDTVHSRGLPPDIGLILIDESHAVAGSKKYRELLFRLNNVPVVGVTATPFSLGLGKPYTELGGPLFESLVVAETIKGLIKEGFLVDCEIYAPADPDLTGVRSKKNQFGEYDYVDSDLESAMDKPQLVGDIVTHWMKLANNKPTIVFATSIPHSRKIVAEFEAHGISAKHLDCYMPEEEKEQIQKDFKAGKFTVLSNCALLAEGFDYPACEVMILARPTKSLIRYIQMVGRILRPFHGKDRGLLLDHSGSVQHLGFPTDDLPLELDDGRPKESKKKKQKEEPKPKKCPKCNYMKAPKQHVCPKCGHKPEKQADITIQDGDLQKLEKITPIVKQEIYSECLGLAKKRGKDDHWAAGLYKYITGVWPRSLERVEKAPSQTVIGKEHSRRIAYAKRMDSEGRYVRP